jgi:hypothetical protein
MPYAAHPHAKNRGTGSGVNMFNSRISASPAPKLPGLWLHTPSPAIRPALLTN